MKTILILGAGLSASSMIRYLLKHSVAENWKLRIVDRDKNRVLSLTGNHENAEALNFDATKSEERLPEIEKADLVISMLPARFHVQIAEDCIAAKKI